MNHMTMVSDSAWLGAESCSLEEFRACVERETRHSAVPLAAEIVSNVPIYDAAAIRASLNQPDRIKRYMGEWQQVFRSGAGIVAFRDAYDPAIVDAVTHVLTAIMDEERKHQATAGDHFAAAGANTRLWNAHEKLCMAAPELFARYNANPILPLASRAWLGPHFQITTQVNVVHPGGKAQVCHRDYHMGFQTPEELAQYPSHVHELSAALTLQGAVAHTDMPAETGPTKLLPYSQTYRPGYFATTQDEFQNYFEAHFAQLPLNKGDALFFNPAVFHAAGENKTRDVHRFANLMQIGSGYGRSIEIVDRARMSAALYPALAKLQAAKALDAREVDDVVSACAEGYPFPANLDIDSPLSGMAPESQQGLMRRALREGWAAEKFAAELAEQQSRKRSH